ncbi:MAG TPA: lecithin retinol acyltransferase family protein [Candidatus Acidoferrales bacterium]
MEFAIGDKIQRPGPLGTWHVGIYLGRDYLGCEGVIHNDKGGYMKEDLLSAFAAGFQVSVAQRAARTWWEQQRIVARARSLLGQKFDLINFNCEHFANYAETGVAHSPQLRFAVGAATLFALIIVVFSRGKA